MNRFTFQKNEIITDRCLSCIIVVNLFKISVIEYFSLSPYPWNIVKSTLEVTQRKTEIIKHLSMTIEKCIKFSHCFVNILNGMAGCILSFLLYLS
jgi:hypothetical protein